jgi:hypothetical protein
MISILAPLAFVLVLSMGVIARWTGASGTAPETLRLLQTLLPDQQRVLGTDHSDILDSRGSIATGPAQLATYGGSLGRLYRVLLPHADRVWGPL